MMLSATAWLIFLAILLLIPAAGFLARKSDTTDWLSAGRRLSLPGFVATLVCTWYGGILGVGEFTWSYGLVNWLALGLFYYVFAILYAFFLAGRIRGAEALSIPQRITEAHGRFAGRLAALFALLMVSPAPYLLMAALILSHVTQLPFLLALAGSVPLVLLYVWRGGMESVVLTDRVQFLFMFLGFGSALTWLFLNHGGAGFLQSALPGSHLSIPGELGWGTLLAWGFVAMWTLVDPGFHQRVAIARDTRTARRGILLSVAFWFVFDGLTTGCGLYARALIPELAHPADAFLDLATYFPGWLQGLFLGGLAATVLSTLDSFCLLSGSTFSRDLLGMREESSARAMKLGMVLMTVLAAFMAWLLPSIVQMWLIFASLGIPVLLPALLSAYGSFGHGRTTRIAMIAGGSVSALWLLSGFLHAEAGWPVYPLGLEPIYPGLLAATLPYLLLRPVRRLLG